MNFNDLIQKRRSLRAFTDEPVSEDELRLILRAALMAPTGKNRHPWRFHVVHNPQTLKALADCRDHGSQFVGVAKVAIVVMGVPEEGDTWVEDCSLAALAMQLQATDLGLGSCWCHLRGRLAPTGESTDAYLHRLLDLPEEAQTECIIALGHPSTQKPPLDEAQLQWEKVTVE